MDRINKVDKDHFEAMYERIIFQKRPTKFANNTWYWIGINQKFIDEAIGQIFQLASIVSQIFYFHTCTPFFKELMSLSITTWFTGKNPVIKIGANMSWSRSICPKTRTGLAVNWEKILLEIAGSTLQYHTCNAGAMYPNPTMKKSKFLFQLNSFCSITEWWE